MLRRLMGRELPPFRWVRTRASTDMDIWKEGCLEAELLPYWDRPIFSYLPQMQK